MTCGCSPADRGLRTRRSCYRHHALPNWSIWSAVANDFIIMDSAPVLSVSDPMTIAARVDGVLLVLRLTKDARSLALGAKHKLAAVDAKTLGVVVNGRDRGSWQSYGETGRDPVEFGSRRTGREDDYFAETESHVVTSS